MKATVARTCTGEVLVEMGWRESIGESITVGMRLVPRQEVLGDVGRWIGGVGGYLQRAVAELFPSMCERLEWEEAGAAWRELVSQPYCPRCGASIAREAVTERGCVFCVNQKLPWQRLVRLGAYREPLAEWIRAMKFARQWAWGPWLGRQLAERLEEGASAMTVVCGVPVHWLRRWRRGYDQAELIGRALAEAKNWPYVPLLRRQRYRPGQTQVVASARRANVRGSFVVRPVDLRGWDVWLVDDVKTTGSTLKICARLLRRRGARCVRVAVAAVADPRGADFRKI